ncbi:MAG: phosphoenolpyruvate carboxykinase (ATP), partial [Betaproteobacteria bacterium]|nr:phosphoenolpyruvate carboxykinase (ATP) [Betaproteobacteria bacterium]
MIVINARCHTTNAEFKFLVIARKAVLTDSRQISLENVVYDSVTRTVDFESSAITENTRASYPIDYIPNAEVPCVAGHPRNVIFLTCDASGVLPPVSRLSHEQAMYH